MISIEAGLYLRIEQFSKPIHPMPLESGFSPNVGYRALGIYSPSETSECYFILSNDRDEVWFISNRHLRVAFLRPQSDRLRISLFSGASLVPQPVAQ